MNTVKRAIIMAAGLGMRLQPLTLVTPKPLIKVHDEPMIENVIKGLYAQNINEICIVCGYLKEQFYYLEEKYTGIVIIENPYYKTCNNISSLYVARDYLEEAMILDGDQIIDEWLMQVNEKEEVISCSRTGGQKGWQLYSVSRWTKDDGRKLKKHLEIEFEKGNTQIYWDDVAMFCYPDEYKLGIYKMNKNDVIEIDSIEELKAIDYSYRGRI